MKKRLLSTLIILCMILTLLPGTALADNATAVTVGGVTLDGATPYWKNGDTTETRNGSATDWNAKFESGTLTLKNATIAGAASGDDNYGIKAAGDLTIVLEGTNSVTAGDSTTGSSYGIHANRMLTINGTGSLTAAGGAATGTNCNSCGICATGILTINGTGLLTATGGTASGSDSIYGNSSNSYGMFGSSVTIEGSATVTATGGAASSINSNSNSNSCGVYGYSSVTVKGGTVTATGGESGNNSFGIYGGSSVTISGGTVTAVGGEAKGGSSCGIYGSNGSSSSNVSISGNDTKVVAVGGKAGTNSYGVNATSTSTITYTSGLLVAKGRTRAMNKAGSDTVLSGAFNGNYIVYGDGNTYTVHTTNQTNNILNNDIIIGGDSAAALTFEGDLALSGFNVVLASGSNSAVHQTSDGGLSLTDTGTLVAVGGSDGGYGIETSYPINPGDSSVVAVGKTGATSNTVQRQEQLVVTGAKSKPVMTWVPAMMKVGTTNCASFEAGWNAAVAASSTAESPVAVKLLKNWTADSSHSFGTGEGFGSSGTSNSNTGNILVPSGKYITLDLNGKTIDRALTSAIANGRVIFVNGGNLTVSDSSSPSTGKITGGKTSSNGGGVFVDNSSSFTMTGGSITGCTAFLIGGGVYINTNGSFTMTGGSITGCTAEHGDGGGGVFVDGTFNVSGTAQVTENTKDGTPCNVYLPNQAAITVTGELQDGAAIGVTVQTPPTTTPVIVAQGGGTPSHTIDPDNAVYFTSDNTAYSVGFDSADSKLKLSPKYTVTYDTNGGSEITGDNGDHSYTIFTVGFDLPDVPTKSGYTFKGWKVTVGASSGTGFVQGTQYPDAVNLISLTKATGNVTLTAQWTANGGGSFSTPTTPATTLPASGSVPVSATISGGKAKVEIPQARLETALEGGEKEVTVDLSGKTGVKDIELPAKTLQTIGEAGASVTVKTENGSVTLDAATLKGLSGTAGDKAVTLSIAPIDIKILSKSDKGMVGERPALTLSAAIGAEAVTNFDGSVTVTVSYEKAANEKAEGLCVWFLDGGKITKMPTTYDPEKKAIVFTTPHFSTYVIGYFPFEDVADSAWYYGDAAYAYINSLFEGTSETEFSPEAPMTRAMLATVLYRLEGEPTVMFVRSPDKAFSDVPDGAWYEKAVQWAQLNGIVEGSDGKFMPDAEITREQLATMLYRYEQYKGGGFTGSWMFPLDYKDAGDVSDWAYEPLCWMTMNKLMQGDGDNLMPQAPATRAQVAAMLHRFNSIEK